MPITRRKRANPPEQPENNQQPAELAEQNTEAPTAEQPVTPPEESAESQAPAQNPVAQTPPAHSESTAYQQSLPTSASLLQPAPPTSLPASMMQHSTFNGDRQEPGERPERFTRMERTERPEYPPSIEGGRRTARGELFRRPPQPPPVAQPPITPTVSSAPLQPPSHEITLPLGNLLHLAYNPSYTGSEEARSELLQHLVRESKSGGRARCWSCGSLAIVYDHWNTRSKTFGEVGIAFCEICGVWSVM